MVESSVIAAAFRDRYQRQPRLFRAPGRVNLIGEHTDYNDGFVMPLAIDRDTVVAAAERHDGIVAIYSTNLEEAATIDLGVNRSSSRGHWSSYVEGVIRLMIQAGARIKGADLLVRSDVPEGAGLSSSAALELSTAICFASLFDADIPKTQLALISQKAEHQYAGTKCGIMDQYISAHGEKGQALLIDCRDLTFERIPADIPETNWVVIDTKVKHSLASSEYNRRREECEEAVSLLGKHRMGIKALRDVTSEELRTIGGDLPPTIMKRAMHVITENERTLEAASALRKQDAAGVGTLMFESHRSLRHDYQVTSPELDFLVDAAAQYEGCYGSRMTGGGFGGCTISLVAQDRAEAFADHLLKGYKQKFGQGGEIYMIRSANGAHEIMNEGDPAQPSLQG